MEAMQGENKKLDAGIQEGIVDSTVCNEKEYLNVCVGEGWK